MQMETGEKIKKKKKKKKKKARVGILISEKIGKKKKLFSVFEQ